MNGPSGVCVSDWMIQTSKQARRAVAVRDSFLKITICFLPSFFLSICLRFILFQALREAVEHGNINALQRLNPTPEQLNLKDPEVNPPPLLFPPPPPPQSVTPLIFVSCLSCCCFLLCRLEGARSFSPPDMVILKL